MKPFLGCVSYYRCSVNKLDQIACNKAGNCFCFQLHQFLSFVLFDRIYATFIEKKKGNKAALPENRDQCQQFFVCIEKFKGKQQSRSMLSHCTARCQNIHDINWLGLEFSSLRKVGPLFLPWPQIIFMALASKIELHNGLFQIDL